MRVTPALIRFLEKYVFLLVSLKNTECQQLSHGVWSVLGWMIGANFHRRE